MGRLEFKLSSLKQPKVYIIAEAGVNHNGQIDLAYKLVEGAAKAKVDAIKFQTFIPNEMTSPIAQTALYQKQNFGKNQSQLEMLEKLTLSFDDFKNLKAYSESLGLDFLSTPFDRTSLVFLSEQLGCEVIKLGSGDLTNLPLIYDLGFKRQKAIISTGMANEQEIDECLNAYLAGFNKEEFPNFDNHIFDMLSGQLILLHCVSQYPAPIDQLNLNYIPLLAEKYPFPVGFSDHTMGFEASIASIALGCRVIEKHITLDNNLNGPDHLASLEIAALIQFVECLRNTELTLGLPEKRCMPCEIETKRVARKSIFAKKNIVSGEVFTKENIVILRPGIGIKPNRFWSLLDTPASQDYKKGDLIED
ncbi:N-acetylneuraminate synthase family protein [Alphaproteobacteria bacterium LSUCC0719]